ncbi:MAG: hypothetical protein US77_C0001G0022 [Microgenomates group bacterium GW2011_GWC1_38_14]|nr:MAG: hypothetical protein US02_C0008G0021 [Candidatus Levybacteria bacterium GW2011_GWA2_36_13]KKQ58536.1 MAG: hypothetical protein US77_C0001G0022 [Microgenomates group bacterium GW2011_GWC1_38_14]
MEKLKDRRIQLGLAIGAVAVLLIGLFLFTRSNNRASQAPIPNQFSTEELPKLSPEDIGMVVTVRSDKRAVMFELKKARDIKHVDYEIRYNHLVEGEQVEEGILGVMNIAEDGITKTDFRTFGTCSATCRYDIGVSDVMIILRVTKTDGKQYQVEKSVEL